MRKHHELRAWQEAVALVTGMYQITAAFPKDKVFSLTTQMRRAAISVPSNIAEGAARNRAIRAVNSRAGPKRRRVEIM